MHFAASHEGFSLLSPFYRFIVFRFPPLSSFSPSLSLSLSSFSFYRSSRPRSPLALTFFRGRRQLPQVGEVRRPPSRGLGVGCSLGLCRE